MKASITTSLLLFFVLLHYARADEINWAECGHSAYCEHLLPLSETCDATAIKSSDQLVSFSPISPSLPHCNIGVHIKPESTKKWTISMLVNKWTATEAVYWKIGKTNLFKCEKNKASVMDGIQLRITTNSGPTSTKALCVFTVESTAIDGENQLTPISKVLGKIKLEQTDAKGGIVLFNVQPLYLWLADTINYNMVETKVRCIKDNLFTVETCEKDTEDCTDVKNEQNWECPIEYFLRFKLNSGTEYVDATIKCDAGVFTYKFQDMESSQPIEPDSKAKCARRRCAQCQPKTNFTELFNKTESSFDCPTLECPNGQYMLITDTKGVLKAINADEPVMCSDKTIVKTGTPGKTTPEKARWNVDGDENVDIDTVVCMETIPCNKINQMGTDCGSSKNCVKAQLNAVSQVFECNNGTAHIYVNETDMPIKTPVCTEGKGKWTIISENSTEPLAFNPGDLITIKCIYEPVIGQKSSAPAESRFPIWIIFVIVFIVLLTIGIVIATYFYRKGRAGKKASMVSKTSKTSTKTPSSSNQSGNPPTSSGEKEPLTSAIGNSITGDSLHTAIPTKPTVVLAKADLRASTAAVSSDTSTNKEKKKKDLKETIPDLDDADEKKREKTCASDETSKKWKKSDMTSTKEKLAPIGSSDDGLKSQTGGDGESLVSTKKNQESAKLLPKNRATPRKYSKSSTKGKEASKKSSNKEFLNLTDSDDDEPSKTGSKRKGKKRK